MNVDVCLHALSRLPRPALGPFFAARTAAALAPSRQARGPHGIMTAYWMAGAFLSGTLLLDSWPGVAILAASGLVVAFPEEALRALLRLMAPLIRT